MAQNRSSRAWIRNHLTDPYVRKATAEGYRSRAAYKLQQLNEKDHLLKPGYRVVDLGSAPGGWSQFAGKIVGSEGKVVAVDILDMDPVPGVRFVRGDFTTDPVLQEVEQLLGSEQIDLVMSDMAPNLSGISGVDQARAALLAELALDFALKHLKPQGNLLVKAFHGTGFDELVKNMRGAFQQFYIRKPEASRSRSSEVYLLGKGLRKS